MGRVLAAFGAKALRSGRGVRRIEDGKLVSREAAEARRGGQGDWSLNPLEVFW